MPQIPAVFTVVPIRHLLAEAAITRIYAVLARHYAIHSPMLYTVHALSGNDLTNRENHMIDREIVLQTLKCNPDHYPHMLHERFHHVLERIVELWHSPEAESYFADLLQPDGRGGGRLDRSGFPDKAWMEILRLQLLCYRKTLH